MGRNVPCRAAVRRDRATVGQQFTGVVEDDHTVAQPAPALLRERGHHVGGVSIDGGGFRACWLMGAEHLGSERVVQCGVSTGGGRGLAPMNSDAHYQPQQRDIAQVTPRSAQNGPFV